jgi:hypothetical protein
MGFASKLKKGELIINDITPFDLALPPKGKGRGLVFPRSMAPYSERETSEPFPASLLIDESEWPERIKEMEQTKTRVSDIVARASLDCKNQAMTNYCQVQGTEVLTSNGWVDFSDYNGSDLLATVNPVHGRMEFQAPTEVQVFDHDGPMIYSTNRSIDFGVTPDHRMLVRKWDERSRTLSNEWTFTKAKDLGWYFGLPSAPTGSLGVGLREVEVIDDRTYSGDDLIALIALVVSDGWAGGTENTRDRVSFACFREDRLPMVRALAARIGFREQPSRPGVFIRYDAGALANWLRANAYDHPDLGSHHKCVPGIVKHASEDQIRLFLEWYGDQSHDRGNHYFSTSKRAIDDIQELLLRVGKRGSIWTEERDGKRAILEDGSVITSRRMMHHLHVRSDDRLSIDRKSQLETEHYRGPVYCATVPNSTLITRRNGSVLISGNCWGNSPAYAMEVIRVIQGQRKVYLSPASACAQIMNYQNNGGWADTFMKFVEKYGLVPESYWPANHWQDGRYATSVNREKAMNYRQTEWWQLRPRTDKEMMSCLLRRWPVSVGYNWWGHQITLEDPVWLDGTYAGRGRNSWGMNWPSQGAGGYFILQGFRLTPDDAVVPRQAKAA